MIYTLLLSLAALCGLYRLLRGPTALDRLLAFDLLVICTLALGLIHGGAFAIDWLLPVSLLGFLGTVAVAFHLLHTSSPEDL